MIKITNECVEKIEAMKDLCLQNLDMDLIRHMSSNDFELCKISLDLFDIFVEFMKEESETLNSIEMKQTEILSKLDTIMNK